MLVADKGALDAGDARLNGAKLRIGVVQARFNEPITNALMHACTAELVALGVPANQIDLVRVPGALEVSSALMGMAKQKKYHALVALGCIIRGETYHFELVANESGAGVTRVALDHGLPVANAILTVENQDQAVARQTINGREAARVAVEMANLLESMQ